MTRKGRAPRGLGPAVVLLSGGMDSATALALAAARGHPLVTLSVNYGQRHARELRAARALARHYRVSEALEVTLPLRSLSPSALTTPGERLPRDRDDRTMSREIPPTYVPARNTIFLALALAIAETRRADAIYLGVNAVDYSGYPDCRPAFLRAFRRMAKLATAQGVTQGWVPQVRAPLLRMTKAEIVRTGERLGVPWGLTWSCYAGGARPCGRCDSCRLRARGFEEAGVVDPTAGRR